MKVKLFMILINIILVRGLTCDELLELPPDGEISLSTLQIMPPKDIIQCLPHLGKEQLPAAEADLIWKTIKEFYNGTENIPDATLMILHWITVAVTPEDYANMSLCNIEVIQNFGLNYNLDEDQLTAIANRVREDFAGKEPEDYTYYDLSALRQILCAFNRSEIERISPRAYKDTALLIGKLERCSAESMAGFGTLAVHERAFGPVSKWSDATMKIVGKVAEYLPQELTGQFKTQSNPDKNN